MLSPATTTATAASIPIILRDQAVKEDAQEEAEDGERVSAGESLDADSLPHGRSPSAEVVASVEGDSQHMGNPGMKKKVPPSLLRRLLVTESPPPRT